MVVCTVLVFTKSNLWWNVWFGLLSICKINL